MSEQSASAEPPALIRTELKGDLAAQYEIAGKPVREWIPPGWFTDLNRSTVQIRADLVGGSQFTELNDPEVPSATMILPFAASVANKRMTPFDNIVAEGASSVKSPGHRRPSLPRFTIKSLINHYRIAIRISGERTHKYYYCRLWRPEGAGHLDGGGYQSLDVRDDAALEPRHGIGHELAGAVLRDVAAAGRFADIEPAIGMNS